MKAAVITAHGGVEVFAYTDVVAPVLADDAVLVDIHAASVNAADWKVRTGASGTIESFPYILGRDFSGVVAATGTAVDDLHVGDPVFGVLDRGQEGAYAEQVCVKATLVAHKPDWLSHAQAAAIALIGLTATTSIEETLALKAWETILIQGAAGGVAGFALQLAKHLGAHVIATAGPDNVAAVTALGADQVIDYSAQDFTAIGPVCDAVFETVGGAVATRSFRVLKPGGRAAFIGSGPNAPEAPDNSVRALRPMVGRGRSQMERILDLLKTGAVHLPEITSFPLADVAKAHRISEGRHLRGKLVLTMR
jgi:NADPH:quinone reductase-like Zn-dependent oxidoreductase